MSVKTRTQAECYSIDISKVRYSRALTSRGIPHGTSTSIIRVKTSLGGGNIVVASVISSFPLSQGNRRVRAQVNAPKHVSNDLEGTDEIS